MIKKLLPPLGSKAWQLLLGNTLSQIGTGLTYPFIIVYLHQIRHIDFATASLVLAVSSVCGLLTIFIGGLVDRFGSGKIVLTCLLVSSVGTGSFALVQHPLEAFAAACLYGFGTYGMWNALSTMYVEVVTPEQHGTVFGINYAMQNVGLGLGAVIAGFVLNVHSAQSFEGIFLADAASFLLFAFILLLLGYARKRVQSDAQEKSHQEECAAFKSAADGYRAAFSDKILLAATVLNMFLVTVGLSQLNSAFPAWVTGSVHTSTRFVGIAILANTLTVIVAQLFVLQILKGHRRTRAIAGAALLFGFAWLLVFGAGLCGGLVAPIAFILALSIFGFGETFLSPSLPGVINTIAPHSLRGRYNAIFNFSWQGGTIIGPVLSGVALDQGLGAWLFLILALCCGFAAIGALGLERFVPASANIEQIGASKLDKTNQTAIKEPI